MVVVNAIVTALLDMFNFLMPVLNLDPDFIGDVDSAIALMIRILEGASYFLPLGTFVMCMGVMLAVDNFAFISRTVKWFIELVRG